MIVDAFVKFRVAGLAALSILSVASANAQGPTGQGSATAPAGGELPFTRQLSRSFGDFHDVVSHAEFVQTLMAGKLTKEQLEVHLQQRALVHNELHRILNGSDAAKRGLYGAQQKEVLVLLFKDLIAMGSGWPTEPQARPATQAFLKKLRDSEKQGPYFALGVQHVYYGGITNGGRQIGEMITEETKVPVDYYQKSDGYWPYLKEVDKITDPEARRAMIAGGRAAYEYIIATNNEDVFKSK